MGNTGDEQHRSQGAGCQSHWESIVLAGVRRGIFEWKALIYAGESVAEGSGVPGTLSIVMV